MRNFNKTEPGWDYSFDPSELNPGVDAELKIFLNNVKVVVVKNEVDEDDLTSLTLKAPNMQIMGFEHAYKEALEDYVNFIIFELR